MPRKHQDRRSQAQRRRPRAYPREEIQRRGNLAKAGKVMLDKKSAVISQRFRFNITLDEFPEPGAAIVAGATSPRLSAPEHSELHCLPYSFIFKKPGIF